MFKYQIIEVEDNTLLVDNSKYKNKSKNTLRPKQKIIAVKYKRNKVPLLEKSFLVEWEANPDLIIQDYVIEEGICKISYILPKDIMYLDLPEGWRYGFPKLFINPDGTKPESIK
jgi:hypothetical protein